MNFQSIRKRNPRTLSESVDWRHGNEYLIRSFWGIPFSLHPRKRMASLVASIVCVRRANNTSDIIRLVCENGKKRKKADFIIRASSGSAWVKSNGFMTSELPNEYTSMITQCHFFMGRIQMAKTTTKWIRNVKRPQHKCK